MHTLLSAPSLGETGKHMYLRPTDIRVCPSQTAGSSDLALPCRSAPGASTKHILDDISTMFDALADQLDAMLD